jgi:hypothetical protein
MRAPSLALSSSAFWLDSCFSPSLSAFQNHCAPKGGNYLQSSGASGDGGDSETRPHLVEGVLASGSAQFKENRAEKQPSIPAVCIQHFARMYFP